MIDFELDPLTNDLVISGFDFHLVDSSSQIAQNLGIRLRFVMGEWFLDITQGIPYYEEIFRKNPNQIQIESILKQEIVQTRGIAELISFEANFDKRRRVFSAVFSARSIEGEEILKEMELPV